MCIKLAMYDSRWKLCIAFFVSLLLRLSPSSIKFIAPKLGLTLTFSTTPSLISLYNSVNKKDGGECGLRVCVRVQCAMRGNW